jgi:copper homeostasis protein
MSAVDAVRSTLEVPVDSIESAEIAATVADRIELCDDLATEGWTPSATLVRTARDLSDACASPTRPRIIAMIRPRLPGSALALDAAAFVAHRNAVDASLREIACCIDAGAHEIAIGLLDANGHIDMAACARLRDEALRRGAAVAFLRVFDLLGDRARGWTDIAALGIGRVLTAGVRGWDAGVRSVSDRVRTIRADSELARIAADERARASGSAPVRIEIAAGGGVRAANAPEFLAATPHLHASCRAGGLISAGELAALWSCLGRVASEPLP